LFKSENSIEPLLVIDHLYRKEQGFERKLK